jgi:hypothetical protein
MHRSRRQKITFARTRFDAVQHPLASALLNFALECFAIDIAFKARI